MVCLSPLMACGRLEEGLPAAIRASARTAPQGSSGIAADGEAPGCARAIRTCSTPGLILKRSGGSSLIASPSIPAAICHPRQPRTRGWTTRARVAAARADAHRAPSDSDATVTPSKPSSILGRVPEPTAFPSR